MEERSRFRFAVLLAIVGVAVSVGVVGALWVYYIAAPALLMDVAQEPTSFESPVDESEGYYNKSEESPKFFGLRTGIVLPEGTKPVYMVHSEGLFPPYRLEAHVIIPSSKIKPFLQAHSFEEAPHDARDLSFLQLTDDLPPEVRPARPEGDMFIRSGDDSTAVPMWWTYVLNGTTGDLWIQYNTE